ncbi:unnamed protein product [Nezara viridula]|uniref:Uncharacterized protein n=1 Tax=Nezara viridula TaxID=85310 RepID=A0A9P0MSI9_NEZVI|nr:unnamed protein product [Nezara viridula]
MALLLGEERRCQRHPTLATPFCLVPPITDSRTSIHRRWPIIPGSPSVFSLQPGVGMTERVTVDATCSGSRLSVTGSKRIWARYSRRDSSKGGNGFFEYRSTQKRFD